MSGGGWFSFLFSFWNYKIWKWLLRLITRRCELQRICNSEESLPERTHRITVSLKNSKNKTLRTLAADGSGRYKPEEAVGIVLRAKDVSKQKDPNFVLRLEPSMYQLMSLNCVKAEVHRLAKEKYSKDNKDHEQTLVKLWGLLMPQTALPARITKRWGDIGFQGNDPATDFRGMGILGLQCLVYFAERYNDKARKVLSNSQHPTKGYPFAITGINMTGLLISWLDSGLMDCYYYTITEDREGITKLDLFDTYSFMMYSFNQFWIDSDPENVMEFPRLRDTFARHVETELVDRPVIIRLILDS